MASWEGFLGVFIYFSHPLKRGSHLLRLAPWAATVPVRRRCPSRMRHGGIRTFGIEERDLYIYTTWVNVGKTMVKPCHKPPIFNILMTYTIHNNGDLGGLLLYWHYGGWLLPIGKPMNQLVLMHLLKFRETCWYNFVFLVETWHVVGAQVRTTAHLRESWKDAYMILSGT